MEEPVTVIDSGVPAVYPAAEYAHLPEKHDDDPLSFLYCKTCKTIFPCEIIKNYWRALGNVDKATKEETRR